MLSVIAEYRDSKDYHTTRVNFFFLLRTHVIAWVSGRLWVPLVVPVFLALRLTASERGHGGEGRQCLKYRHPIIQTFSLYAQLIIALLLHSAPALGATCCLSVCLYVSPRDPSRTYRILHSSVGMHKVNLLFLSPLSIASHNLLFLRLCRTLWMSWHN